MLFFCAFPYLGGKNAMLEKDELTALCALNKVLGYVPAAGHALLARFGAAAPVFFQRDGAVREAYNYRNLH